MIFQSATFLCFLAAANAQQTYDGFTTQHDTSAIVKLGLDQKTLEGLINDNKDSDAAAAEQGFAAGFALYNGSTPGASSLVFQQLASDATFFQDSSGTTFPSFQKYVNYFGTDQYMDISCLAGFQRQDADFSATGGPNFEYSLYDPRGRADVIEKATNYLVVFMMIQGSLEKAVDRCRSGEGAAAADYLDQAVAYYVGSEELTGPFYYNLAVSRCGNFDTCDASGKAPVNNVAWNEFAAMKQSLASSNCNAAATSMNKVIDHMVVPLIQGTLRYAIFLGLDGDVDDKTKGEGAIFAQAVLPYIAACDAGAAQIIFDNMKPVAGAPTVEFAAVRDALESTYGCLGISKSDIGCYEGRDETCPTGVTIVSSSGEDVVENGSAAATSSMYVWAVSAAAAAAAALLVM